MTGSFFNTLYIKNAGCNLLIPAGIKDTGYDLLIPAGIKDIGYDLLIQAGIYSLQNVIYQSKQVY